MWLALCWSELTLLLVLFKDDERRSLDEAVDAENCLGWPFFIDMSELDLLLVKSNDLPASLDA